MRIVRGEEFLGFIGEVPETEKVKVCEIFVREKTDPHCVEIHLTVEGYLDRGDTFETLSEKLGKYIAKELRTPVVKVHMSRRSFNKLPNAVFSKSAGNPKYTLTYKCDDSTFNIPPTPVKLNIPEIGEGEKDLDIFVSKLHLI